MKKVTALLRIGSVKVLFSFLAVAGTFSNFLVCFQKKIFIQILQFNKIIIIIYPLQLPLISDPVCVCVFACFLFGSSVCCVCRFTLCFYTFRVCFCVYVCARAHGKCVLLYTATIEILLLLSFGFFVVHAFNKIPPFIFLNHFFRPESGNYYIRSNQWNPFPAVEWTKDLKKYLCFHKFNSSNMIVNTFWIKFARSKRTDSMQVIQIMKFLPCVRSVLALIRRGFWDLPGTIIFFNKLYGFAVCLCVCGIFVCVKETVFRIFNLEVFYKNCNLLPSMNAFPSNWNTCKYFLLSLCFISNLLFKQKWHDNHCDVWNFWTKERWNVTSQT